MKRLLIVVLLVLAASPITAPFAVQDLVALPGGVTSVHAKKAGDDLQPAIAGLAALTVAVTAWIGSVAVRRPIRPHVGRSRVLPLRL